MKNSRKTAVLLAALLSVSLCACGPVEEAADSVSETKDTTTAEAVSDTPWQSEQYIAAAAFSKAVFAASVVCFAYKLTVPAATFWTAFACTKICHGVFRLSFVWCLSDKIQGLDDLKRPISPLKIFIL